MALTVEDGSVVAGADSYISLANAELYMTAHGSPAVWTSLSTDAKKEAALRYATQWLDGAYNWRGVITDPTTPQALAWPRAGVVDSYGRVVQDDEIPQRIKDLQCEAALVHISAPVNTTYERGGQVQSRGADGASISYFSSASVTPTNPYLDSLAAPYVISSSILLRA